MELPQHVQKIVLLNFTRMLCKENVLLVSTIVIIVWLAHDVNNARKIFFFLKGYVFCNALWISIIRTPYNIPVLPAIPNASPVWTVWKHHALLVILDFGYFNHLIALNLVLRNSSRNYQPKHARHVQTNVISVTPNSNAQPAQLGTCYIMIIMIQLLLAVFSLVQEGP